MAVEAAYVHCLALPLTASLMRSSQAWTLIVSVVIICENAKRDSLNLQHHYN